MTADQIFGGNRELLAELRAFAIAHPDTARHMSLIQVMQVQVELRNNPELQKILRQEGKQSTLMQAISLLTARMGMESAK